MSRKRFIALCEKLPHATHDIKWKSDLVYSVGKKMFACFDAQGGPGVSFKTTPANFAQLTQAPGVIPAPYAARFHWVYVQRDDALPAEAVCELLRESYRLLFDALPAGVRTALSGTQPKRPVRLPRRKVTRSARRKVPRQ
jgi:predicted DNA-binding protein (MmcQ/YjbR family)